MDKKFTLEVACFTVSGAVAAAAAGADRLELCENPTGGGTTPSYGILNVVRNKVSIPVFPIIRPREGDFFYTALEYEAMQHDIKLCKSMGFEGVVLGMLHPDGTIDVERTAKLTELAYPMQVTFHRAFDRCSNPFEALVQIINIGCKRILTSGQRPTAMEGIDLLKQLTTMAANDLIIMPGGGINSRNIETLYKTTGATEFHAAARLISKGAMSYHVTEMDENLTSVSVNSEEVSNIRNQLKPKG